MFMDSDGDHSAVLFPLFEREAALQAAINREMYKGKLRVDEVLTKENQPVPIQFLPNPNSRKPAVQGVRLVPLPITRSTVTKPR